MSLLSNISPVLIQSLFAFFLKGLGAIAALLMSVFAARQLGAEQAGYFFLAITVVSFFGAIARCGLDKVVLRHTAAAEARGDYLTVRLLLVRCLLITVVIASIVGFTIGSFSDFIATHIFMKPDFSPILKAATPAIVAVALLFLFGMSFQGLRYIAFSVLSMNVGVNLLLVLALIWVGFTNAQIATVVYSVAAFLVLIVCILIWIRLVNKETAGARYDLSWNRLLVSAWPLWLVLLMQQLIEWAGQLIGGVYLPPEDIARLSVAQRIAFLTSFILVSINLVVAPRFAALHAAGDYGALEILALSSVRLMIFCATPIVGVMLFFPEWLMGFFGEGFSEGALLLQILALGQFANVVTGSVGYLLIMSGHEKDLRNILLVVAPASIVITFALTYFYGAVGSAISTTIAIGVQNILAVYWVKRRLGFNTLTIWRKFATH